MEPAASPLLSQGVAGSHGIQGIGANFIPSVLDRSVYDEVVTVTDEEAFATAKELCKMEGYFVGISSGAAVAAAIEIAKRPENKGKNIVTILPDEGGRYLLSEDIASAIAEEFDAKIVLVETCAGVTSYYCYTPRWQDTILIEGQPINLHVAVSNERCAVGAPIIFGGF